VAASGGYWLSMCATQIFAEPTTITGSIGVIAGWVWDKGIGEKVGMEGDFVEAGKHADLFYSLRPPLIPVSIPHRAVTEDEREMVLVGMKSMYASFAGAVAKNRNMPLERVEELAQGRVWTGLEAKSNGLIDRIGGLTDAIAYARELIGVSGGDEVEIRQYGPRGLVRWNMPTPALSLGALSAMPDAAEMTLARWLLGAPDEESATPDAGLVNDYDLIYLRQLVQNVGRAQCLLPPDVIPQDGSRKGD
jgi:protease-4